jgi:hypothetical protein
MKNEQEMRDALDNLENEYSVDKFQFNIIEKLGTKLGSTYKLDDDGKIRLAGEKTATTHAPWLYVRPKPELDCHMWHRVLFDIMDVFPPKCGECWKVVVRPRNFRELMMLLEIEENHTERYCKCGHEERPYVFGQWGGYFYCDGKEEGLEVYKEVRALVDKLISPDVSVTLKRYCSEYELKYGPTDQFSSERDSDDAKEKAETWERVVGNFFDVPKIAKEQLGVVKADTITRWMKIAYSLGDETVLEFNKADEESRANGGHLYKQLVTYHHEAKESK